MSPDSGPFRWSREHDEFRSVVRDLVTERASLAGAPSPRSDDPAERVLWRNWSDELGLPGLAVPERYGGSGFSRLELAIVANELGRAVIGGPFFASAVLASEALLVAGGPVAEEVLPALAAGTMVATLAVVEAAQRWQPDEVATTVSGGSSPRLRGVKDAVLAGEDADLLVVAAREDAGVSLFAVVVGDGVAVTPLRVLDSSRPMARLTLTDAPARRVGAAGEGWAMVECALEAGSAPL